jgi:hypothetical protein
MSTAYGIDSGAIRSHASTVTSVASSVREASSAGSTTVDASAFGLMCSFLAPPACLVSLGVSAAISHLADAVDELAQDPRTMASGYETNEQVTSSGYARAKKDFSTILGPS